MLGLDLHDHLQQLLGALVTGISVFFLATVVIVLTARKDNNAFWLERAGGDPQKAKDMRSFYWTYEKFPDEEEEDTTA